MLLCVELSINAGIIPMHVLYAVPGIQTHDLYFCLADVQQACKDARVNATTCMQLLAAAALECSPQATKGFQPSVSSATSKKLVTKEHQSSKAADSMHMQRQLARVSWETYQHAVSESFEFTAAAMTGLWEILTAAGDSHVPT